MTGKWLTWANGITFFRLGLLVVFVWLVVGEPFGSARGGAAAVTLFFLAWSLDGLDGWVARRRGEASELGSAIDKIADRVILATGLGLFLVYAYVPWYAVLLVSKDAMLVPLLWWRQGRWQDSDWSMGRGGKLVTVLQGGALVWLVLGLPGPQVVVAVAALAGVVVGAQVLAAEARASREE